VLIGVVGVVVGSLGLVNIITAMGEGTSVLLLVLGLLIIVAISINTIIRCCDPLKQKWFRAEDSKEEVDLPENYKRYRRNMGDEDSEGEVVVTSGSSEDQEYDNPAAKKPTPKKPKATKNEDTTVDIQRALHTPSKSSKTDAQTSPKKSTANPKQSSDKVVSPTKNSANNPNKTTTQQVEQSDSSSSIIEESDASESPKKKKTTG